MSGNEWESGDGNDGQNGPKALREHLEKIQAELKEQRDKNAALEATNRANAISGLLTSKGFNPKIAALVPTTIEATEEKLTAWLDENSELFPKADPNTPPNTSTVQSSVPDADTGGQVEDRIGSAVAMGLPPDKMNALMSDMANAKTPEDLDAILQASKGVRFS